MTNAPSSLLGLIIVLGVLIFVHEGGHFLVAKLFGVRVLVFSLGFGKRLLGFRRDGQRHTTTLTPIAEQHEYGLVGIAGIAAFAEPVIGVDPGSPAARGGVRNGDRIVAVNGKAIAQLGDATPLFAAAKEGPVTL